jgi:hypothetical protein
MLTNIKFPNRQRKSKKGYLTARENWMKHVLADRNLSARAKIVATMMVSYFNYEEFAKDGRLWAWPSLRTLDKATGQSRNTILAAIKDLQAAGYLEVHSRYDPVRRRYKSHRYLAQVPGEGGSESGTLSYPILNQGGSDGCTRVVQTGEPDSYNTNSINNSYAADAAKGEFDEMAGSLATALPTGALRSPPPPNEFYAAFGSPELDAWDAYGRMKGKTYPRDKRGGWTFPTQWPPDYAAPAASR